MKYLFFIFLFFVNVTASDNFSLIDWISESSHPPKKIQEVYQEVTGKEYKQPKKVEKRVVKKDSSKAMNVVIEDDDIVIRIKRGKVTDLFIKNND
jgi:ribosomal protein L22